MALSDQQFKAAYWLATRRKKIRAVVILALSTCAALLWGAFLFFLITWVLGMASDGKMMSSIEHTIVNFSGYRASHTPVSLEISNLVWNHGSTGTLNAVVKVKNMNQRWIASSVSYSLRFGTETGEKYTTSVLPGEEKFLPALNNKFSANLSGSAQVSIEIISVSWRWLERVRDLPDVTFTISNVSRDGSTRINFDVTNDSVYDFWGVPFAVVATGSENGVDQLGGATIVQVEQFKSNQTRTVSAYSPQGFGFANSVEILPDLNILDQSVFQ